MAKIPFQMTIEAKLFSFLNRYDFLLDAFIEDVRHSNHVLDQMGMPPTGARLRFIDNVVYVAKALNIKSTEIITAFTGKPNSAALNPTIFIDWEDVQKRWVEFLYK